jgi:aspartate--ammonia ligase
MALYRYGYTAGEGIYTDMNAIRRDDDTDNLHSIFVDQWDWEKVITREQRNEEFLKETVKSIVKAIVYTKRKVSLRYPVLANPMNENVTFVTTQELENRYPDKTPKERENLVAKEYGTVFIQQIGGKLASGQRHDGRAPDYDDWALNGDLFFWNETLQRGIEISSMGIRVDADSLKKQLEEANATDRMQYQFHQMIANDTLPLSIGGGIGQSRLCMLLLEKAHIGEVQASIWSQEMIEQCKNAGIILL